GAVVGVGDRGAAVFGGGGGAEGVGAGGEGAYGDLAGVEHGGHRPHLDGVRDQHAVEAELAPQELGQGGAAECRGQVRVEGGDEQVAAHARPDAGRDGGAEGRQVAFGEEVG